jgi:hypothetical protein
MFTDFYEASCSLLLPILATILVMQFVGRKLTYIMMAIHNLHVEYGHVL